MKDRINQILTLLIWAAAIILWTAAGWWYLTAFLFLLHFAEIFAKGMSVGKKAGKSPAESFFMTLVFGFTWWLPLEKKTGEQN